MASGNKGALALIIEKLRDPFLLAMLALVIVLTGAAQGTVGLQGLIVISMVVVVLFFGYLAYSRVVSHTLSDSVLRTLVLKVIVAIKDEGYVPGNARQADLGAALIRHVIGTGDSGSGVLMALEFKTAFRVPDSYLMDLPARARAALQVSLAPGQAPRHR